METKEVLKYHRENDSWLCPVRDTENGMVLGNCMLCGCKHDSSTVVLKQWTEADEKPITPPPKQVYEEKSVNLDLL